MYMYCASSTDETTFQLSQGSDFPDRHDTSTTANREILAHLARSSMKIPQLDGPIPDPYDDVLSTPNVRSLYLNFKTSICGN